MKLPHESVLDSTNQLQLKSQTATVENLEIVATSDFPYIGTTIFVLL